MNSEIVDSLRRAIGRDHVLADELWREIYSRDASYFNIKPICVARPQNQSDLRKILAIAASHGAGVTFRAAGSSLSGQTVGAGIICELRTGGWTRAEVRTGSDSVWFEPGLTARQVNNLLMPYHRHIGPDPASSNAAMMGGILSNNSSGMQAGVAHNAYHTLKSIRFMLADGSVYDTALSADRSRFMEKEKTLSQGLLEIRDAILSDAALVAKIRAKYSIKNVTGYAMNSFVDFEDPLDIFSHLLIGGEGTLAYILSAELATLPLFSTYSSCMLYFRDATHAAASAAKLGENGALAVELMDYASLRSSQGLRNDMPYGTTAMLVDYGTMSSEEMSDLTNSVTPALRALDGLLHVGQFTTTVSERQHLWKIRDGVFPCVAGVRSPGSTVILEDVAAPVENLDKLVEGVQHLFSANGYEGAIFGHARDGNIHPLVTTHIDSEKSVSAFRSFMDGLVDLVIDLDGSLKGEHGTGRAIAPFVEKEWGSEIYGFMKKLKRLADPGNILNPGVMINDDPDCFINSVKSMDLFGKALGYDVADKCTECGYCEHVCPSRYVTLTPRQRLQARRIIAHTGSALLERQYAYIGNDTCCADGSCQLPCPMGINTGDITDSVRAKVNSSIFDKALSASAGNYAFVESSLRFLLKAAVSVQKVVSPYPLIWASDFMHMLYRQSPHWSKEFPMPPAIPWTANNDTPDFIYFPACVTRIFGNSNLGKDDMMTVMLRVGQRAGYKMALPKELHGICCSQIWEHKGDPEGQKTVAQSAIDVFYDLSNGGEVPIVCDTTSCTHSLLLLSRKNGILDQEHLNKFKKLKIVDITDWLADYAMPRLKVTKPKGKILLHPTCASRITGLDKVLSKIASLCAEDVVVPDESWCCGAAGDRGFIFPEVARTAVGPEKKETADHDFDGCYSLAKTCELSMMSTIGKPYESIVYLVDETTS